MIAVTGIQALSFVVEWVWQFSSDNWNFYKENINLSWMFAEGTKAQGTTAIVTVG